jgi:hypothetical protein
MSLRRLGPPVVVPPSIEARKAARTFVSFHKDHPEVYDCFERTAKQLYAVGHQTYSAAAILHGIRLQAAIGGPGSAVKINNNHAGFYARMYAAYNIDAPLFNFRSSPQFVGNSVRQRRP